MIIYYIKKGYGISRIKKMNNEADIKELNDRLTKVKDEIAGILTAEN
jgi:hypothetical protein